LSLKLCQSLGIHATGVLTRKVFRGCLNPELAPKYLRSGQSLFAKIMVSADFTDDRIWVKLISLPMPNEPGN
jgi:hypothetical protein